jgi:hypothetical protein
MAEPELLLVDTTYLLPLFGLESKLPNYEEVFPSLFTEFEVMYNPVSLLEAKWLVIGAAKKTKGKLETFLQYYREGIGAILREDKIHQTSFTDESVEQLSDKLLVSANLKDYFDRQIYSTAAQMRSILLTEDDQLHDLAKKSEIAPKPKAVKWWSEISRRRK